MNNLWMLEALLVMLLLGALIGIIRELREMRKRRIGKIVREAMERQLRRGGRDEQYDVMCEAITEIVHRLRIPAEYIVPGGVQDEER